MKPAETRLLKINLEKESKGCGTCKFCSRYEISLYGEDIATLQNAAKEILNAKPGGPLLRSEYVINVLTVFERLQREKVYCRQEHCWTHFLEPACALWQPRELEINGVVV